MRCKNCEYIEDNDGKRYLAQRCPECEKNPCLVIVDTVIGVQGLVIEYKKLTEAVRDFTSALERSNKELRKLRENQRLIDLKPRGSDFITKNK